ncbi:Protein phosphatase methylesterase, eukaryotic,Alpha/beta hydrolase fold-1,Alpha/Beta [Cinara cedri]|uniref:Protein phosphatase methylesterase 1 n=1 Tax=Cinara cedri TaxID=506608 RepID=A0A5E4MDH4_9HEMI|nr:Protein phosphatase methylesterase, eukaryotic,Alpha/beta hydrolase fold-1,Alpha/Beta [Cinara cedri]
MSHIDKFGLLGGNFKKPPQRKTRLNRSQEELTPLPWHDYFEYKRVINIDDNKFTTYLLGNLDSVLIVLLHGGGFNALTWSIFAKHLVKQCECQVLAIDLRGHGSSFTTDDNNLSMDTFTNDVISILRKLYPDKMPSIVLMGHSLGGAVAVNIASTAESDLPIIGLVVIDVVEGSAMESLASMQSFLRSRPKSFKSLHEAIAWGMGNGHIKNKESARVSIPGQIKNIVTGKLATDELEESTIIDSPQSTEEINKPPYSSIDSIKEDEECGPPSLSTEKSLGIYTWRIDLCKTEKYWPGWFQGLSNKFLSIHAQKLLLLANIDRMDKDLTVGQMQGKFEMQVLNRVGHAVQEDDPDKVASILSNFLVRNKFANPTGDFIRILPGC